MPRREGGREEGGASTPRRRKSSVQLAAPGVNVFFAVLSQPWRNLGSSDRADEVV